MLRAVTFDYWDTLYAARAAERATLRRAAIRRLLEGLGHPIDEAELRALYDAAGKEAERWWREEHRGYSASDRIRWMLERLGITRPDDCEHVARACEEVDATLLRHPPSLLPGAADGLTTLSNRYPLAIISDTGFASGTAQSALLERDGLLPLFSATVYSVDIGHAKPRLEPFIAALDALRVDRPDEVLHVGDVERTDVRGALDAGMRAVRVDLVSQGGPSAAEFVARSFPELVAYLMAQAR
jgi:putative hydrolase of the HAD superfamily